MQKFNYTMATEKDAQTVVNFMHKLGKFQNMEASILVTKEKMEKLLKQKKGEAIICYTQNTPIAFAYFCEHSSAFIGETCVYIDAFYVDEEYRKQGIGKSILQKIAKLCKERGYARMEWGCLDWNTNAWNFYINLGSVPFDTLTLHRLSGEDLNKLSNI